MLSVHEGRVAGTKVACARAAGRKVAVAPPSSPGADDPAVRVHQKEILGSARSSKRALAGRARSTTGLRAQINTLISSVGVAPRARRARRSGGPARSRTLGGAGDGLVGAGAAEADGLPPAACVAA